MFVWFLVLKFLLRRSLYKTNISKKHNTNFQKDEFILNPVIKHIQRRGGTGAKFLLIVSKSCFHRSMIVTTEFY